MKATTFALILLSILTGTCLTSCIDDDFTTNPSHVLAFSTDTVAFDTVFTTIGTSTRSFRIYNPNKKSLNISSIKLADAEHSGFHINVDGMSGDNFTNVEIRGKDSLYVFVEANIDPANQDNPIFIVDSIVFVTNGIQQDVKLTAYGQDVIIKRGETFTTDTHQNDIHTAKCLDALFIQTAVFDYGFLRNSAVNRKHILLIDIYLAQKQVIELCETASCTFGSQGIVFI